MMFSTKRAKLFSSPRILKHTHPAFNSKSYNIISGSPGSSRETGRRRIIGMIFACSTLTIPFAAKFPLVIEKDLLSAEKNVSASNMIGTKFWS